MITIEEVIAGQMKAWSKNNAALMLLLENIPSEGFDLTLSRKGSRSIKDQFYHLVQVRAMWLEAAATGFKIAKPTSKAHLTLEGIKEMLTNSSDAISGLIHASLSRDGKVKGSGMDVFSFIGYLISHESHHRGNILLTLKVSGVPLNTSVSYALWDWKKL